MQLNVTTGKKKMSAFGYFLKEYELHLMLLLPVAILLIFCYAPMFGIVIGFMKYLPAKGFAGSYWTGLQNFQVVFTLPGFMSALKNTVVISGWKIVMGIVIPVLFTLLLNEVSNVKCQRVVQTLIYLPHFISWVILSSVFMRLLKSTGIVNQFLGLFGAEPIMFLGDNDWFPFTLIATDTWKEFGYSTIVYLAAIQGISRDLYEAADVDGANHLQQVLHVTLPGILPIVILMSVLSMGNILNGGFDQVFNMYSTVVYKSGDIIDTIVYRMAFDENDFGRATAAGLFKSIISAVFVAASYKIAYATSGYRVF